MSDATTGSAEADRELIGYGPAAEYLQMHKGTLSSYVSTGYGPTPIRSEVRGQYRQWVFLTSELDRWKASRPGRGARTDRMHAGLNAPCIPCAGACQVSLT